MSLYYQYIQGNITREELEELMNKPCDTSEPHLVEFRPLNDEGEPTGDWTVGSLSWVSQFNHVEIREIKNNKYYG